MSPIVEQDDPTAILRQTLDPLREKPVHGMGRREPMNEHDRLMPIRGKRLEIEIGYLDAIREKTFHWDSLLQYQYLT